MDLLGEFQKLEYVDRLNTLLSTNFLGVEIPRFSRAAITQVSGINNVYCLMHHLFPSFDL